MSEQIDMADQPKPAPEHVAEVDDPFVGRDPAVRSVTAPTGAPIYFPSCADWSCDDEYDWEVIGPSDPDYPAVKREEQIARYHEPRSQWRERLQEERDKRSGGDPLWWGKPTT